MAQFQLQAQIKSGVVFNHPTLPLPEGLKNPFSTPTLPLPRQGGGNFFSISI
jgi:hypothetical protein